MADCHDLLTKYDDKIKLDEGKKKSLRTSRDALRARIKKRVYEAQKTTPKFHGQGSFMTHTIITPSDEDYDIDDGVYFLVEEPPTHKPATFHRWIVDAVEGHTEAKPVDKDTCVRVIFKAGYHVDLPIYYKVGDDHPRLAHKRDGWIESDPKEFMEWVRTRVDSDGQLKRIVRYLKGWKDNLGGWSPSGLVFTILACNHVVHHDRDDVALRDTLKVIRDELKTNFSCLRPTTPVGEDLLAGCADSNRTYFLDRLDSFIASADEAIAHQERRAACLKWRKHLGPRLECPSAESLDKAETFSSPAFIKGDARSA